VLSCSQLSKEADMRVAEVLRKYQGERNLREYAQVLGISLSHLWAVLNGERNAGNEVTRGFLKAFPDAATEYIAAFTDDSPAQTKQEAVSA